MTKSGTQMEVPGTAPADLAVAVKATNDAVAVVEEAKVNLRRAQAAERLARRLEADIRNGASGLSSPRI